MLLKLLQLSVLVQCGGCEKGAGKGVQGQQVAAALRPRAPLGQVLMLRYLMQLQAGLQRLQQLGLLPG
jgi:hypothetical protein